MDLVDRFWRGKDEEKRLTKSQGEVAFKKGSSRASPTPLVYSRGFAYRRPQRVSTVVVEVKSVSRD